MSFNAEKFVVDALDSVLAQDYAPLDILVSDDASTDRSFELLQARANSYRGPHRVQLLRRSQNTGSKAAHLNALESELNGDLLVFFDADDLSEPDRVTRIVARFADPHVYAVYSSYGLIDAEGQPVAGGGAIAPPRRGITTREWFASVGAYASGTTLAIRRSLLDTFGPLDPEVNEDVSLPFRASLLGEVEFIDRKLVKARRHPSATQGLEHWGSVEALRRRHKQGVDQAEVKCASRMSDLASAERLFPNRLQEFEHLRRVVRQSVRDAQNSVGLFERSLWRRLRALVALRCSKLHREQLLRDVAIALSPRMYVRYRRRRLRRVWS